MVCAPHSFNYHFFILTQKLHTKPNKTQNNEHRSSDGDARMSKDFYPFPDVSFFRSGTEGFDSSDESNREPISEYKSDVVSTASFALIARNDYCRPFLIYRQIDI